MPSIMYTCSSYCIQNSGLQTVVCEIDIVKTVLGESLQKGEWKITDVTKGKFPTR